MINEVINKLRNIVNPFNVLSQKAYPKSKKPKIISYYQKACLGVRPQKFFVNFHQKRHTKLKIGRTKGEREQLCVAALKKTSTYPLPSKCLADSFQDLNTVFKECLLDVNKQIQKSKPNAQAVKLVTSEELFAFISKSTNPKIQQIAAKYSENEIRMMSKDWLQISNSPRFLAKQLSTWASDHSAAHLYLLNSIHLTVLNVLKWQPHLLKQRPSATIKTFALSNLTKSLRITHELAIPLEKFNSLACKKGQAGSNAAYPNNDFVSYCLVIEYAKDPKNNAFLKVGRLITGFIRDKPYNNRMLSCLEKPSIGAIPWGGVLGLISIYQQVIIKYPLKRPAGVNTTLLPLITPISQAQQSIKTKLSTGLIKRLTGKHLVKLLKNQAYPNQTLQDFGRLSSAIMWLKNWFMRNDYK